MNVKKIGFALILILCPILAVAQNATAKCDTLNVREIVESRTFKINILNVLREGGIYMDIFSKNTMAVTDGSSIEAKFPYFYRSDNPATAGSQDIRLKTSIAKMKIKEKKKEGGFKVDIRIDNPAKYLITIDIDYDGYCFISVTNAKKQVAAYSGHLSRTKL